MSCQAVVQKTLNFLQGKKLILFLDFDGTLAEVQEVADNTYMEEDMEQLLRDLSQTKDITTVAISGRKIEDLQRRVGLKDIIYSGNHGLEINMEGKEVTYCLSQSDVNTLRKGVGNVKRGLEKRRLGAERGGNIEDKDAALTWHYFKVPESEVVDTLKQACDVIKKEGFQIFEGVGCLEVRSAAVTKGDAMHQIIQEKLGAEWERGEWRALFLGDSFSDEEGYLAICKVPDFQHQHFRFVRVLPDPSSTTFCPHTLESVDEVYSLLAAIRRMYNSSS